MSFELWKMSFQVELAVTHQRHHVRHQSHLAWAFDFVQILAERERERERESGKTRFRPRCSVRNMSATCPQRVRPQRLSIFSRFLSLSLSFSLSLSSTRRSFKLSRVYLHFVVACHIVFEHKYTFIFACVRWPQPQ